MKAISLNVWWGRVNPAILEFVERLGRKVDAFCFQEMMRDTGDHEFDPVFDPNEIRDTVAVFSELLPDFEHRFSNFYGNDYGVATFVRRSIGIRSHFERPIYLDDPRIRLPKGDEGAHCRKVLVTTLGNGVHLANLHGMWIRNFWKGDHADRIKQSEKIVSAVNALEGPKILMGDFNLDPHTQSYAIIKDAGFECMVERYGITDTRTPLYEKTYSRFADYALVTPDVRVRDFRVLPDVVSDHAALFLEIEA